MNTEVPLPGNAKAYTGRLITVTFDAERCLHAAECVQGMPEVFDAARRPWIRPDAAGDGETAAEAVAQVVRRCPSGALQYRLDAERDERPSHPTEISRAPDGRLVVRGDLLLHTDAGPRQETRAVLCGCGASAHQPYCDHAGVCGDRDRDGRRG